MYTKTALAFLVLFLLFFISCQSTDKPEYIERVPERMIANVDPIPLQNLEIGTSTALLGMVKQTQVKTEFHPKVNHVSLAFQYQTAANKLFFSSLARVLYAAAVDEYITEFDNKELLKSYQTRYIYGRVAGYLKWGAFQLTAYSHPEMQYGYTFKGPHPYFTITVKSEKNEAFNNDKIPGNVEMVLYMTKDQALALKNLFSQENIDEALSTVSIPEASTTADDY